MTNQIVIDDRVCKIHPTYDSYAADDNGNIYHIGRKVPIKGSDNLRGYLLCNVRKSSEKTWKSCLVHRFIWECHNGLIPYDQEIDHINNDKYDNRLCNLQLLTHQENCKKRDNSFVGNNHKNRKGIKATNCQTNVVRYFQSMYACQQRLGINVGIIKMVCEGKNKCKTGLSPKDCCRYVFEYYKPE